MNLGAPEVILGILVIVLLFGAKKIPELAQGLGKGIREFKKAAREVEDDVQQETKKLDDKTPNQPK